MYALEIGLLRVSKSRSSMFRNALTILLVSAVALLGQYSGPADEQTRTVYPDISQPSDQPSADPDIQTTVDGEAAADQKHGVARISIVQGDVNVKRGDTGELTAAVQNAPLMTQDRLQTSNGSRAEIQLDAANLVRLAPNTDVGMADLQYHRYQIQLGAGTIIYRVLRSSNAQVEVDTPNVGFRPVGEGEFRISVLDDGTTQITARSGKGEIFGPHGSEPLPYGQTLVVRGDANDPEFRTTFELARDQFDDWSEHRDSDLLQAESYRYVSPDIAGAEDLDRYGQWVPSQYGQVWAPQSMPADWSPYSNGEWVWQDYYGWTWVDSSAWGWAPYHYGRWFYNGGYGWCWWLGAVRTSYYWSPALVGFWGWGGFGLRAGLGGLGWCALAPYERFHRWWGPGWYGRGWDHYRYGGRGFRPYGNFTHNADIARMYRNAAYRGGAMMARHNAFGGPHQRFTPATRTHLVNASAFQGGRMPVTPTRASYQFSTRSAVANPRLTSVSTRRFFNGAQFRNPASAFRGEAVQRVAPGRNGWSRFGQAAANGVAQNRQRPAHGVPPNMRSNFGNRGDTSPSRPAPSGWQRFGDPGNGGALREGFTGGNERSGWHRFGQPEPARRSPAPTATPRSAYSPAFTTPRYNAPAYNAPRYSAPRFDSAPRYNAPRFDSQPRFNAPAPRYNAPAPRFDSSPRFNVQPRMSAPRSSGPRFDGGGRFYGAPARPSATPRFSAPHSGAPRSGGFSRGGSFGGSRGGFSGGGRAGGGGRSGGGGHGGGGARHR